MRLFKAVMLTITCANMCFLASDFYNQPQYWNQGFNILDVIFTVCFLIDMIIKIMAADCTECVWLLMWHVHCAAHIVGMETHDLT